MRLHFYEPPADQKAGGLDLAIRTLRDYLVSQGSHVQVNPSPALDSELPDVVHFHGLWQPGFLRASRWCGKRSISYVVSPHGMLEPWAWKHKRWKKLPYFYLFERVHLRGAGAVLATSEQEARNLSRFASPEKIVTIPLGLADERSPAYSQARQKLGWKSDETVLLFLSRIHPKKGLHLLLEALCSIEKSLPKRWRLVIVGDGDEKYLSKCRACTRTNENVFRHTEWKGAVWGDAKWDYFQAADLFCLPSFSENFGLAILEACQVGTRVLTTPYTPWGFLTEWRAAITVEPEIEPLKQGLLKFVQSTTWGQTDRDDLAERIRGRFAWQVIGRQYLELYERLGRIPHPSPLRK